ncbi:MAG TPA: SpoIIE family protein phosphatase [Planctomycetota bacterium]|jgi:serine phosphatase RsbU (regulator of sigma subunit)|nr:SpoIIE family protein phosphatase [Planctomycetota bacterium]
MSLATQFALTVSVAVGVVMVLGALLLYSLVKQAMIQEFKSAGLTAVRTGALTSVSFREIGEAERVGETLVQPVEFTSEGRTYRGHLYRRPKLLDSDRKRVLEWSEVFLSDEHTSNVQTMLLSLFVGVTFVLVFVAVVVAFQAAKRGVAPMQGLIEDIGLISHGRLDHPIRLRGGGEVGLLTRAVDRMIHGLREAREAERSLERREHDLKVAAEVRESLLPKKLPPVPGYEIAGAYRPAEEAGGDLYDLLDLPGGRVGLLVAEVSGKGVTAALLMTMTRTCLRAEALRAAGPREALIAANRSLAPDMRRGLFVSVLYAVLDPPSGSLRVANAGHKVPLLRFAAAEGTLRAVHSEGIALGFDPGPVFERTIAEVEVPLALGDRAVLLTGGAFLVRNPEGTEIGERGVYASVKREAAKETDAFVHLVLGALEHHAAGAPFPSDAVLATVRRLPS